MVIGHRRNRNDRNRLAGNTLRTQRLPVPFPHRKHDSDGPVRNAITDGRQSGSVIGLYMSSRPLLLRCRKQHRCSKAMML
jgi:hypothetical protein